MEIREYLGIIKRRFWIVLLITIVAVTVTAICNKFLLKDIYEANTKLFVSKQTSNNEAMVYNDLLIGQSLVKDYRELAKSRTVSERVVKELRDEGKLKENINPKELSEKISVNLCGETRVIEIKVEDESPTKARDLANKAADVFKSRAKELMKIETVEIVDTAILPDSPVKPKRARNIAISGFIGLMLGLGLIFLLEYMDNTIKTPEDVEKYLGLPVIGAIPVMDNEKEANR